MNIRRFTRFVFVLAIVALIAGLSACDELISILSDGGDATMPPQLEGLSGEIPVGLVLSQTGEHAASFGLPMQRGFELALEEINNAQRSDARIRFIIEDDRGTIEGAVEAFNKLIDQHRPAVILGPTISSQTRAAFPIAQQHQVVAFASISAASGLSAIGDFNFRVNLPTDVLNPRGVSATQKGLGYQRVATIYDENDLYSTDSDKELRKALTANGIEILTIETFQGGSKDFSAQFTRIKAANPDAIFVSALNADMAEILIQGRQLIPALVPFIVPDVTMREVQIAGEAAEGVVTFTSWAINKLTPGNQAFVQNYNLKYGMAPSTWAAQSYAAVYILSEALANAGSTDSTAIRDAMANITDFDTVLGQFSFNAVGDAVYDPAILIVKDGELQIFE